MQKRLVLGLYVLTLLGLVFVARGAATVTGVTGDFGSSGQVHLDSNGITVDPGLGSGDGFKFEGPGIGFFYDTSVNVIYSKAAGGFNWERSGASLAYTSLGLLSNSGEDLGTSSNRWGDFFLSGTLNSTGNIQTTDDLIVDTNFYLSGDMIWTSPPTTSSNDYPLVYSTGTNLVYRKTDGFDGTCSSPSSIVVERGIVVGCS